MFKLLGSVLRRVITAVTSPFRMLIVRIQRLFNINVITSKFVTPLSKKVRSLITLKPQSREDYISIGRWWVYKKLFATITLILCAGVFLYFTMISPLPKSMATAATVKTTQTFDYNNMKLREFTGVANIRAADGAIVYTGDIKAGVCSGIGTLWDRKGRLVYEGGFDQNRYSGAGTSYYPSGKVKYEGNWESGLYAGEGSLRDENENLLYRGSFKGGVYEGPGKFYSAEGILLYEGAFSGGLFHGIGTVYYANGTVRYKGEFHQGVAQGKGQLYAESGKLLYTGDMYDGRINHRALLNSTYADVLEAFAETPRVFYTDADSAFVFEQAGIVITVDCRVRVSTWEKLLEEEEGQFYYMPDDLSTSPAPAPAPTPTFSPAVPPVLHSLVRPVQSYTWYVAQDDYGTYNDPNNSGSAGYALSNPIPDPSVIEQSQSDSSSSESSEPPLTNEIVDSESSADDQSQPESPIDGQSQPEFPTNGQSQPSSATEYGSSSRSPESTQSDPDATPSFIEKQHTLYYEVDANVWQDEDSLDAGKVRVKKVTVFIDDLPPLPEGAVEFQSNEPPYLDDCIAIEMIRQTVPTAYPQIIYELDLQNRSFVRLWNINYAQTINRKTYLWENMTYRYSYQDGENTPLYFSIER